ncbi:MAG: hypothetical protein K6T83_13710 [Alicyclobacillus sp.]|nr:hypothetical protein [Alicyclobacillus sp.]
MKEHGGRVIVQSKRASCAVCPSPLLKLGMQMRNLR